MYIVIDKITKKIIHNNPAPLDMDLKPLEVFCQFNPKTMEIGKTNGILPEHFEIDINGQITEWSLEKKVKEGIISLKPHEKIENGEIIVKPVEEQVKDGLIQLTPFQKIEDNQVVNKTLSEQFHDGFIKIELTQKIIGQGINEQIVEKTLEEKVREGLLTLAPNQKISGNQIVNLADREMLDENRIDLNEYKKRRIDYFSNLSLTKRQMILPDYKIQNAALGMYEVEKTEAIKNTIQNFKNEFNRIRDLIEKAQTVDAIENIKENYPVELD